MTDVSQDPLWAHRLLIEACLRHRVPFFWRGPGALLIAADGIATILNDVLAIGNVTLLGLEGFELDGRYVRPRLDLIYDAERTPSRDPLLAAADWDDGVWVDVTLGSGRH